MLKFLLRKKRKCETFWVLDMCPLLLKHIGSYVDNPYASMAFVNRYLYSVSQLITLWNNFSMNVSIFLNSLPTMLMTMRRTQVIIGSFPIQKIQQSRHVYLAFRDEFFNGSTKLNRLIPHLMKYSYRINGNVKNPFSNFGSLALVERKRFWSHFRRWRRLFHRNGGIICMKKNTFKVFRSTFFDNPTLFRTCDYVL